MCLTDGLKFIPRIFFRGTKLSRKIYKHVGGMKKIQKQFRQGLSELPLLFDKTEVELYFRSSIRKFRNDCTVFIISKLRFRGKKYIELRLVLLYLRLIAYLRFF